MSNGNTPKTVIVYRNAAGKEPFTDWLNSLRSPAPRGGASSSGCYVWNRATTVMLSRLERV